jgi:hypothetical protein
MMWMAGCHCLRITSSIQHGIDLDATVSGSPSYSMSAMTPPYREKWSDIVPHLSVAQLVNEQQIAAVAEDLAKASQGKLPIRAFASKIALMDNRSGRWGIRDLFSLGA